AGGWRKYFPMRMWRQSPPRANSTCSPARRRVCNLTNYSACVLNPRTPLCAIRISTSAMRTSIGCGAGWQRQWSCEALEADWLKTAEVRERLDDPKASIQQVRNALRSEAEARTIERDPPLSESGERKTQRWRLAAAPV